MRSTVIHAAEGAGKKPPAFPPYLELREHRRGSRAEKRLHRAFRRMQGIRKIYA
jgi:hypothetical protein